MKILTKYLLLPTLLLAANATQAGGWYGHMFVSNFIFEDSGPEIKVVLRDDGGCAGTSMSGNTIMRKLDVSTPKGQAIYSSLLAQMAISRPIKYVDNGSGGACENNDNLHLTGVWTY